MEQIGKAAKRVLATAHKKMHDPDVMAKNTEAARKNYNEDPDHDNTLAYIVAAEKADQAVIDLGKHQAEQRNQTDKTVEQGGVGR